MTDQLRAKIKHNESYFISEKHNKRWTKSEILSELDEYPERFSPNVFFGLYINSVFFQMFYTLGVHLRSVIGYNLNLLLKVLVFYFQLYNSGLFI